jgi:hypothetical protein
MVEGDKAAERENVRVRLTSNEKQHQQAWHYQAQCAGLIRAESSVSSLILKLLFFLLSSIDLGKIMLCANLV